MDAGHTGCTGQFFDAVAIDGKCSERSMLSTSRFDVTF